MEKSFETLIKEKCCNAEERWYPTSVDVFRNGFIAMSSDAEGFHPLVDNLAYNLQYLQFLEKEIQELNVSSVIYSMLVKTYVITGMGIVEGIFSYVIKSNGWWKTNDEEEVLSSTSEITDKKGITYRIRTIVNKKVAPVNDKMNFDDMIKCLKHHHKALSVDHLLYPQIDRVRDLRNRVHLQKGNNEKDHDYNAFDYIVKKEMRNILYELLCSPKVSDQRALHNYDFLKPEE